MGFPAYLPRPRSSIKEVASYPFRNHNVLLRFWVVSFPPLLKMLCCIIDQGGRSYFNNASWIKVYFINVRRKNTITAISPIFCCCGGLILKSREKWQNVRVSFTQLSLKYTWHGESKNKTRFIPASEFLWIKSFRRMKKDIHEEFRNSLLSFQWFKLVLTAFLWLMFKMSLKHFCKRNEKKSQLSFNAAENF